MMSLSLLQDLESVGCKVQGFLVRSGFWLLNLEAPFAEHRAAPGPTAPRLFCGRDRNVSRRCSSHGNLGAKGAWS